MSYVVSKNGPNPGDPPQADEQKDELPAPAAARYRLAILLWMIGFAIMLLFEIIGAIWRR